MTLVRERIRGRTCTRGQGRGSIAVRMQAGRIALRLAVDAMERVLVESSALPFDIGDRWLFDGHRFMEREELRDRWGVYGVRWSPIGCHESRLAMMEALDGAQIDEALS